MRKILVCGIVSMAMMLSACEQDSVVYVEHEQPRYGETFQFYDEEERGMVYGRYDYGNPKCYTLYEPDGDTEYYCNGQKQWEIEGDDGWDSDLGWAFAAGAAAGSYKTKTKPKYVSNSTRAVRKPPSNALKAQQAVRNQQSLTSKTVVPSTAKTGTAATKAKPKPPTVDLTKKAAAPQGATTVNLSKKPATSSGATTVTLAKPKPKAKTGTTTVTLKKKPKPKPKPKPKKKKW